MPADERGPSEGLPAVTEAAPAPDVYAPEGYPACPFCGEETSEDRSKIVHGAHLAIERLVAAAADDVESEAFWNAYREVVSFVGGEVDA